MHAAPLAARPVRHANALALLVFALLAVLAGVLVTATGDHVANAQPVATQQATIAPSATPSADEQFLVDLMGPGVGYTAQQAQTFTLAADRVCEALTAQVPLMDVADHLVAELDLTDTEARDFATTAARTHC